jgi:molybdopterin/thiamine biosynthesis adenylyltransferase
MTGLFKKPLEPVTIIGVGAIGSRLAIELAKAGVPSMTIYDPDIIESHNICNQAFDHNMLGMFKVDAVRDMVTANGCLDVDTNACLYVNQPIYGTVFLCVDSMKTRKEIMEVLKLKPYVDRVIDTRMGVDEVRCYNVNRQRMQSWFERSDYDDGNAEVSACGTVLAVGATAGLIASVATWIYMKPYMEKKTEFETIMSTNMFSVYSEL